MKIYAFISTLSFFSILSSGLTQDEPPPGFTQDEPPRQQAPAEPTPGGSCGYVRRDLVLYEGENIQTYKTAKLEQCKRYCDGNNRCNSFTYCTSGDRCHLKTDSIDQYSQTKKCESFLCTCKSYYPQPSCQRRETCKPEGEYCGYAGNGNDYGSCCNNMDCTYEEEKIGGAGICTIRRASCKSIGQYCGAAGNGNHYGNCCNTLECTFSDRKIGGAGTCTSYVIPPEPPCVDDQFWTDFKHGDGKDRCDDMTRNYCNSNAVKVKDGTDYGSEARKACPFSCQLC